MFFFPYQSIFSAKGSLVSFGEGTSQFYISTQEQRWLNNTQAHAVSKEASLVLRY